MGWEGLTECARERHEEERKKGQTAKWGGGEAGERKKGREA